MGSPAYAVHGVDMGSPTYAVHGVDMGSPTYAVPGGMVRCSSQRQLQNLKGLRCCS